jgi:hypothetical protein
MTTDPAPVLDVYPERSPGKRWQQMATADSPRPQARHYSDDVLIANLLAGMTVKDAAAQSGITEDRVANASGLYIPSQNECHGNKVFLCG